MTVSSARLVILKSVKGECASQSSRTTGVRMFKTAHSFRFVVPVCGSHTVYLCDTRMLRNVDRKSSYPHCGDNRVDNACDYPHIGDNSVDSLGTICRLYQIDLHQSRQVLCEAISAAWPTHRLPRNPLPRNRPSANAQHAPLPHTTAPSFGIIDAGVRNSENNRLSAVRLGQAAGKAAAPVRLNPADPQSG